MKITICGSIAFYPEMQEVKRQLEEMGHEIKLPPTEVKGKDNQFIPVLEYYQIRKNAKDDELWVWDTKAEAIMAHFEKIDWSDAILVLNNEKNGIAGYVGGNTLMEIGVAFFLKKKIYFLNSVPDLSYKEELLGMKPILIEGDLKKII